MKLTLFSFLLLCSLGATATAPENILKDERSASELLTPSPIPAPFPTCDCTKPFEPLASQGDPKAVEGVAKCLAPNQKNTCTKDQKLHVAWVKAAATRGRIIQQLTLAFKYTYGEGVKQDLSAAADWWAQTARQNLPDGYFMLGKAYEHGEGRPKNMEKAMALYRKAKSMGNQQAIDKLENLDNKK